MSVYQEALNIQKENVKILRNINFVEYQKDFNLLQELVDKETPKKLTEGFGLVCPNCKTQYVIGSPKVFKYCPECGQRWSEDIETRNQ